MGKRSVLRRGTAPKRFLEFVRNVRPDENSFPVCHRFFRFSGRLKRPIGGTACKPNSVSSLRMTAIHLGRRSPVGSSNLPGNVRLSALRAGRPKTFPYLVLHREEFAWPYLLPDMPVGSYPTVSPITPKGWSVLCCTCRHPNQRVPGRYPARCPLVFGLSSLTKLLRRPSGCSASGNHDYSKVVEHL